MGCLRVVALGVLLGLLPAPAVAEPERFPPLFDHPVARAAHRAFRFKQYGQAVRLADRVLRNHRLKEDERSGLLFIKAQSLLRAGDQPAAIDAFETLMQNQGALSDHAAWYHGSILLQSIPPAKKATFESALHSLARVPLSCRFGAQARNVLVKNLLLAGKEEEACRLAAEAVQAYAGGAKEAGAMLQLALCRERLALKAAKDSGWPQAREMLKDVASIYRELSVLWPHLPSGMRAVEHSKRLSARGIRPRSLDPGRLLSRARKIAGRLRSRRDLYTLQRIKSLMPKNPKDPSRCEVDILYGVLAARYRWFGTAYRTLRRVMKHCPDPELRARANLDVAGLLARRQPRMAIEEYLLIQKRWPESSVAPLALYKAGELARRRQETDAARSAFLLCVEKYPTSLAAAHSRWGLAWTAYREENYDQALSWLEFLLASIDLLPEPGPGAAVPETEIPGEEDSEAEKPEGDDGAELEDPANGIEGREDNPPAEEEKPEEEEELAQEWRVTTPFDIERRRFKERVGYWRARILERRGDIPKAAAEYRRLASGRPYDYYALMAWNRLADLGEPLVVTPDGPEGREKDPPSWKDAWRRLVGKFSSREPAPAAERPTHPEVASALSYLRMGLEDESRATLLGLRRENLNRVDRRVASRIWDQLGDFNRSHRMAPISWEGGLPGFPEGDTHTDARLAYPQAFSGFVLGPGRDSAVPPDLLFALIRAESGFWVRARSAAWALGLTQMVRRTAYATARKIKMKGFRFWKLFDPEVAIRVGSAHLAELLEHYRGYLPLALAAYNAGEKAVTRWLARRGDLSVDAFIEEIPYAETNRYVRKLISFYAIYRALYNPQARQPLRLPFDFDENLIMRAKQAHLARQAAAASRAAAKPEQKKP